MKYITLFPPILIILSHLKFAYKLQAIELFIFSVSLILYIYYNDYQVKKLPQKPQIPVFSNLMPEEKLEFSKVPSKQVSNPETPLKPPIKFSQSYIDSSLDIPKISVPEFTKPQISSFSYTLSPVKSKSSSFNRSQIRQNQLNERVKVHRNSFLSNIEQIRSESYKSAEDFKALNNIFPLFDEIQNYFNKETVRNEEAIKIQTEKKIEIKQVPIQETNKVLSEPVVVKKNLSANLSRIVVDPYQESYHKELQNKIEMYKKTLPDCTSSLNKTVSTDIKGIVSQITSDVDDLEHLNGRIKALLDVLGQLNQEDLKKAIYFLCETVVNRGADQADSIDLGGNFAINYTKFILEVAKVHNSIHELYYLSIISKKYLFYPLVQTSNIEEIEKRNHLKDINPSGTLADSEKDKLTRIMDACRAYGFLLGTLLASKDSKFNEGDIWRYFVYILNLKKEFIDRAYMTFLLGFFKSSAKRLRECYGKQYLKLVKFLSEDYTALLASKFGNDPYLRAYITQLREAFNKSS